MWGCVEKFYVPLAFDANKFVVPMPMFSCFS